MVCILEDPHKERYEAASKTAPNHAQAGAQKVGEFAQSVGDLCGDVLAAGRTYCGCWFA